MERGEEVEPMIVMTLGAFIRIVLWLVVICIVLLALASRNHEVIAASWVGLPLLFGVGHARADMSRSASS